MLTSRTLEDDWRTIFHGTDACNQYPTQLPPGARAYHVLSLDFTLTVSREPEVIQERLNNVIVNALEWFVIKYALRDPRHTDRPFPINENDALASLEKIDRSAEMTGGTVRGQRKSSTASTQGTS